MLIASDVFCSIRFIHLHLVETKEFREYKLVTDDAVSIVYILFKNRANSENKIHEEEIKHQTPCNSMCALRLYCTSIVEYVVYARAFTTR